MGVPSRHFDSGMSQNFLDCPYVATSGEHVSSRRMADHIGTHRSWKPSRFRCPFKSLLKRNLRKTNGDEFRGEIRLDLLTHLDPTHLTLCPGREHRGKKLNVLSGYTPHFARTHRRVTHDHRDRRLDINPESPDIATSIVK